MLFDPYPKTRVEDLFDREREFDILRKSLELGERFIVVYGIRRIGKTSFIHTALKKLCYPHVIVDVREIYSVYNRISKHHVYRKIADYFTDNMEFFERIGFKMRELIGRIKGFKIMGAGIEIEPTRLTDLTELFKAFNRWAIHHNTRFVIAFDEAQYLRFSGAIRYDMLFSWAIDNLEAITVIVTGSEVGVLRDFLKIDDPNAPLYGRYRCEIKLEKFSFRQSIEFLEEGFKQLNVRVDEDELREVVEKLDAIPGWLTLYGYYRGVKNIGHREALEKVFTEGSKMVLNELNKIIEHSRDRYLAILEAIVRGATTWSQIKTYVMYRTGEITDKRFTDLLRNLIRYGIVEKTTKGYRVIDPLVEYVIRKLITT